MGKRILPRIVSRSKELVWWGETANGNQIYRTDNSIGGQQYWSDEIGGGVMFWDTSLVSPETLQRALELEEVAVRVQPKIEARMMNDTTVGHLDVLKEEELATLISDLEMRNQELQKRVAELELLVPDPRPFCED